MIPREILKKIRQIELRTNRIVIETFCALILGGLLGGCTIANPPPPKGSNIHNPTAQVLVKAGKSSATIPPEIPINKGAGRGGWLIVNLRLEDSSDLPFMVDTGSPVTVLDKSLQHSLETPIQTIFYRSSFGNQASDVVAAPKLYLENTPIKTDSYVITADLSKMSKRSGQRIMGILGLDCLRNYCVQLDFEAGKMRLLATNEFGADTLGKAYSLDLNNRGQNLPPMFSSAIRNESLPYIHHLDLAGGSNTNLLIDTGYNNDGAVENGAIKGNYLTRFVHFLIKFRDLRIGKCEWNGETYDNLRIGTGWNVLGLRFLARHLVTFDFPNRTMYLKKVSSSPLAESKSNNQENRRP